MLLFFSVYSFFFLILIDVNIHATLITDLIIRVAENFPCGLFLMCYLFVTMPDFLLHNCFVSSLCLHDSHIPCCIPYLFILELCGYFTSFFNSTEISL